MWIRLSGFLMLAPIVCFGLVFAWHVHLYNEITAVLSPDDGIEISTNLLTNDVSVRLLELASPSKDDPFSEFTVGMNQALTDAAQVGLEDAMNARAREERDVYALLIPYEVTVYPKETE